MRREEVVWGLVVNALGSSIDEELSGEDEAGH